MNLNWRNLAEMIAVLSVVLSLIFVGVELRQNTNVAKASSYREITEGLAEQRTFWASDPEVAAMYQAYAQGDISDFSDVQRTRLDFILTNIFSSYENAYFSRKYGVIGDAEWQRFETGVCRHYQNVIEAELNFYFLSEEFIQHLGVRCKIE